MVQKSRKVWPKLDYLQLCKTHSERCKVENMMLTCCQDHILTENILFVWSKRSYSGDERRCYRCGMTNERTEFRKYSFIHIGSWLSRTQMKLTLLTQMIGPRLSSQTQIVSFRISRGNVRNCALRQHLNWQSFKGQHDLVAQSGIWSSIYSEGPNHVVFCETTMLVIEW